MLVGGGHAHVQVLRRFEMQPPARAQVAVVLDVPVAVYSGMVPGFVAGQYEASELEIDVVPLARRAGARVVLSAMTGIDPEARRIHFADRPPLSYDLASLDIGSTVAGLDLPGVREHAVPTRPIARFVRHVDELVEQAATGGRSTFDVVVVGAGAGGVELAFTLGHRLRSVGATPRVRLLQAGSEILIGYPGSLVRRTERAAEARGIEIRRHARVAAAEAKEVVLDDKSRLPFDALVWVTGAVSHPVLRDSPLPTDDRGFVLTRSTLQVEGHDDLFAVGDCGTMIDFPETPKAGVYAVRQGPYVAENLLRQLDGRPLKNYRPQHDFLTLLNLGDGSAFGAKWGASFEGRWVMRLKDRIDRAFMQRFQVLRHDGRVNETFSDSPAMSGGDPMPCGGCAAKLGQGPLGRALARLPLPPASAGDDAVEMGLSAPDDAAVWRTASGAHIAATVDLFSAFTDDPYLVGRVAAVNALSDLWASGATPRVALAVVALPEDLDRASAEETLFQLLAGARTELDRAGVALAGGHTTLVPGRLMVGFAVDGEVDSGGFVRKGGLRPGDVLLLTKPLGTGVIFHADMHGRARGSWIQSAMASMLRPNDAAASVAVDAPASAMTDVTGFGLAGHLLEMLSSSGVSARIDLASLPLLPGASELFSQGERSTLHAENVRLLGSGQLAATEGISDHLLAPVFDPQTSGGLLFGIGESDADRVLAALDEAGDPDAAIIGQVGPPRDDGVRLRLVSSS